MWDRASGTIVSNDFRTIGIDLATQFHRVPRPPPGRTAGQGAPPGRAAGQRPAGQTYPEDLREEIEELDAWLGPAVNWGVGRAAGGGPDAEAARTTLLGTFADLDLRLARSRYLLGDRLTEADVRLWVTLVRYDAGPNARRAINPGLDRFPHLWSYARRLYRLPAFRDTTDFATFTAPGATVPNWTSP
ncbi:hypothetical protein Psuf_011220 [Phytohabitans suffuscus]|uniref:GST C-terminal domain-containing protein n=1 Tax=Phytohabitans suffuscus TaxID=624315 RepID=A0A6F8YCQ7_9ACTN|nr:hypothetical protein Psuf_011220 [Phytohabitans suffuscus]